MMQGYTFEPRLITVICECGCGQAFDYEYKTGRIPKYKNHAHQQRAYYRRAQEKKRIEAERLLAERLEALRLEVIRREEEKLWTPAQIRMKQQQEAYRNRGVLPHR